MVEINLKVIKYGDVYIPIGVVCKELKKILTEKNKRYGDSALYPINVFNRGDAVNSLYVRIDDKISRVRNNPNSNYRKNDICDMLGYGILIAIANKWPWGNIYGKTSTKIHVACTKLRTKMRQDNTVSDLDSALFDIKHTLKLKEYLLYKMLNALVYICIENDWLDWGDQID